jgi:hypothetical protein
MFDVARVLSIHPTPIHLEITERKQATLVVTADRVRLTRVAAMSRGQLEKAILKAWLLQILPESSRPSSIRNSFLKVEVLSDTLALLTNSGELQDLAGRELELAQATNWLAELRSFRGLCESAWQSVELAPICSHLGEADETWSRLSLRRLMTSLLVKSFQSLSPIDRPVAIRAWLRSLHASHEPNGTTAFVSARTTVDAQCDLACLRDETRESVLSLLPLAEFNPDGRTSPVQAELLNSLRAKLRSARLESDQPIRVDYQISFGRFHDMQSVVQSNQSSRVAQVDSQWVGILKSRESDSKPLMLPGGVRLSDRDIQSLDIRSGIFVNDTVSVAQLMREMPRARRWALVEWPFDRQNLSLTAFASFVATQAAGKAAQHPSSTNDFAEVRFAMLEREPILWAVRHGFMTKTQRLSVNRLQSLLSNHSTYFGFKTAQLDPMTGIYRLTAPVEIVESYRP